MQATLLLTQAIRGKRERAHAVCVHLRGAHALDTTRRVLVPKQMVHAWY